MERKGKAARSALLLSACSRFLCRRRVHEATPQRALEERNEGNTHLDLEGDGLSREASQEGKTEEA